MSRLRLLPRALLIALLVPVAGAALGMAAFRWEQVRADWRPKVVRIATGWRVSQASGLSPVSPAVAGDHLAWSAGPYTILLDLKTGRTKLLGAAHDAQSTWAPKIDDRYVVWLQATGSGTQALRAWVYDTATRRRVALTGDGETMDSPAVSGSTVYWSSPASQSDEQVIRGQDLLTGRRFTVGSASGPGGTLEINGRLACWVSGQATPDDPTTIGVLDLAGGERWSIPLFSSTANASLMKVAPGGGHVAWLIANDVLRTEQILVRDLATGRQSVFAGARGIMSMAFDGATVVWAEDAANGKIAIMGRRLDGTPAFTIAEVAEGVQDIAVSGETVAWLVNSAGDGSKTWIETARMPQ